MNRRELLKLFTFSPLVWPTVVGPLKEVIPHYKPLDLDVVGEGIWFRVDSWRPSIKGRYRAVIEFSCTGRPNEATLHSIECAREGE